MKTNKQSKIKVPRSGYKRSRFNWSHDVNTTLNWGELQPSMCKMLVPGSKTTLQTQDLVRLAPMVAPTFGRVKYKTYSQFVGMSDIFPNWSALMAQEPVSTAEKTQIPISVPRMSLGMLSTYVLWGARSTIYWIPFDASDPQTELLRGHYRTYYKRPTSTGYTVDSAATTALTVLLNSGAVIPSTDPLRSSVTGFPSVGNRLVIAPYNMTSAWDPIFSNESVAAYTMIPLGNTYVGTGASGTGLDALLPWDHGISAGPGRAIPDQETEVTFDGADYVLEFTIDDNGTTRYFAIAFEFSDLGKRLRKILQGCGYQIDLQSVEIVSILPLLAQYKAYFDIFGLTLYQSWETTYAAKFIKFTENNFGYDVSVSGYAAAQLNSNFNQLWGSGNPQARLFVQFMINEVANEWYTDTVDYVSAHIEKLAVSPDPETALHSFISVDSNGVVYADDHITTNQGVMVNTGESTGQVESLMSTLSSTYPSAVHAFINKVEHGEVDSELLKRMYRWTNRNTVLGRVIADLLRAQGLGKYVDETKSNYIGSSDVLVTISDVISTANTSGISGAKGAILGEYGGRGLQYNNGGTLVFENDEYGYWITLCTIVPEAGYVQGLDPTLTATDKFHFYNPEFDGLGMEMTKKETVVGCRYLSQNDSTQNDTVRKTGFGFVPMYSKFKVCQNVVNGDFNRHNMRNVYLPYTLDKQLNINDYDNGYIDYQQAGSSGHSYSDSNLRRSVTTLDMPIAGNIWRMPTKYAWLGNFNRIFAKIGLRDDSFVVNPDVTAFVGYSDYNDDNFLCHSIYDCNCYAPMKPIEKSYGLEEDDPDQAGVDFVAKA